MDLRSTGWRTGLLGLSLALPLFSCESLVSHLSKVAVSSPVNSDSDTSYLAALSQGMDGHCVNSMGTQNVPDKHRVFRLVTLLAVRYNESVSVRHRNSVLGYF